MDGGGCKWTEEAANGWGRLQIDGADCEWMEEACYRELLVRREGRNHRYSSQIN